MRVSPLFDDLTLIELLNRTRLVCTPPTSPVYHTRPEINSRNLAIFRNLPKHDNRAPMSQIPRGIANATPSTAIDWTALLNATDV